MQIMCALFFILLSFFSGAFLFIVHNRCIDFSALEQYNPGKPSILLDDQGVEWARFQLDRRKPIAYSDMPLHLTQAFLAVEDRAFFKHIGISCKGIVRSCIVNLYNGRVVQGASTITQQLVKLLFTDARRTIARKLKDQLYALLVERQFTKEQILETYLNHVCFGCGIYGVEAAAQRFWGKSACDLTLEESAALAGIVKNPGRYCPILFPLSCQNRRNLVLHKMHEAFFITECEMYDAQQKEVLLQTYEPDVIAPHLKETIRQFLENKVGKKALYSGGLIIQTTLNRCMQEIAEQQFKKQINKLKKTIMPEIDGALISMAVNSGEVKALIGGFDFRASKFNRALQAKRQLGSVFKAFVYAAAVEQGMRFNETEVDEPLELTAGKNIWKPRNYDRSFTYSPITLAYALSRSNNIVPVKILLKIGVDRVINCAKRCHIRGPFYPYPSLALGCVDTTLEEAAAAFNVFAHNGVWVQPHYIRWVKDMWGNKLYKYEQCAEKAMNASVSGQVAKVMGIGLDRVKKLFPQKWPDTQAISKTGTTNDSRTCWFAGSTPEYTTLVYIGCDDNRSMGNNVYPLRTAFPIWIGLHKNITYAKRQFTFDPSLKELLIHEKTGQYMSDPSVPGAITIYV